MPRLYWLTINNCKSADSKQIIYKAVAIVIYTNKFSLYEVNGFPLLMISKFTHTNCHSIISKQLCLWEWFDDLVLNLINMQVLWGQILFWSSFILWIAAVCISSQLLIPPGHPLSPPCSAVVIGSTQHNACNILQVFNILALTFDIYYFIWNQFIPQLRPNKKICVFPVSRPTLFFRATLNILLHF